MKTGSSRFVRPLMIAAAVFGPLTLLGVLSRAQNGAHPPTKGETSGKYYKNVKILKDLPADQMIPAMHRISLSLGVRCDFCHVVNADHTGWEKDDKPEKVMARKMMVMSQDLNRHQKILAGKTTCYMCHHGRSTPETEAPTGRGRG